MDNLIVQGYNNLYSFYRSVFEHVESNMYVLVGGNEAIVVDAVVDDEAVKLLQNKGVKKINLFLTHEHYDHSHGIVWLKNKFDVVLYCHNNCSEGLSTKKNSSPRFVSYILSVRDMKDGGNRYESFKNNFVDYTIEGDVTFTETTSFFIAGHTIKAIHTPGHTPGSCIYTLDEELVFTGDSMIQDNKIITGFRGGNKDSMLNITLPILKNLNDELMIMPGHGNPFKKKEFNFSVYDF